MLQLVPGDSTKVLILGSDGYLGWPLTLRLLARGHEVSGMDNLFTRRAVAEVGSTSGVPILGPEGRVRAAKELLGSSPTFYRGDVTNYKALEKVISKERPDAVVHFAEQRSAPYSMIDERHAAYTMSNNIVGTINLIYAVMKSGRDTQVVKMGTMGEFGTPNFDIPEAAWVDTKINGKMDTITVPKWAGSWYHWTKVHDTNNLLFANRLWGITSTDIMQGPVYGLRTTDITDPRLFTRFDFDGDWGTVLNRYCVEAVLGMPLTVHGKGGQVRGFLSLEDSMEALRLLLENPPEPGGYRPVNQFRELYSVAELADFVKDVGGRMGLDVKITNIKNPRVEKEQHHYKVESKVLPSLGFNRLKKNIKDEIRLILEDLAPYKSRLGRYRKAIMPRTLWKK